jgi:SAM-dependent methyltransferase
MIHQLLCRLRSFAHRFTERLNDWRYGIVSDTRIFLDQFGVTDPACHQYNATSYLRFRQLMKLIDIRPGEDVFLDYGSGMGRAVFLAATYPFRRVIGVELIPEFHAQAAKNIEHARPRLRCRDVKLINIDARSYQVPGDVTVIYLWNPFSGHVLCQALENIRQSVLEHPRRVTMIFLNPPGTTSVDQIKSEVPWLAERRRVTLGPNSVATIYELAPSREPEPCSQGRNAYPWHSALAWLVSDASFLPSLPIPVW